MKSFKHYYVQGQNVGGLPQIIYHTHNEELDEYYYKFSTHKKAQELLEAEKEIEPDTKYRVVKCTVKLDAGDWI